MSGWATRSRSESRSACRMAGRPTSAWFDTEQVSGDIGGGVLHVGYLTPEGSYAEVRQTDGDGDAAVDDWVDGAVRPAASSIGDGTWQLVESEETGKQGLVLHRRGVTIVVTGKAELGELEELAGSLRDRRSLVARRQRLCSRRRGLQPGARAVEPGLADRGELFAALPQRDRALQGQPTALELLDDIDQLVAGGFVARGRCLVRCAHDSPSVVAVKLPPATRTSSADRGAGGVRTTAPSSVWTRA